mgnify:FL=1
MDFIHKAFFSLYDYRLLIYEILEKIMKNNSSYHRILQDESVRSNKVSSIWRKLKN